MVRKSAVQFTGQQRQAAPSTRKHFKDVPAVQCGSVGIAAGVAWPSRKGQASASARVSRKSQEFSAVPLSGAKICKPAKPITVHWVLYILPPNIMCPWICMCLVCKSVTADITLPIGRVLGSCKKLPAHHQKVFGVFLWSSTTHVRQTNTSVSLTKNLSHVLSHTCFSKTSFHLCPLQRNVPSRVCFSKTPSNTTDLTTLKFPLHGTLSKLLKVGLLT